MEELAHIYRELNKVRTIENIQIEDNELFSYAVEILLFREGEKNKDKRTQDISNRQPESNMATEKQKALLKKYHYNGDLEGLTKKEASTLIDELFKKGEKSEGDAW